MKKDRIKQVLNGNSQWVCFDCANKHKEKDSYVGTVTVHDGECFICEKTKGVGNSRKLFGQYRIT